MILEIEKDDEDRAQSLNALMDKRYLCKQMYILLCRPAHLHHASLQFKDDD